MHVFVTGATGFVGTAVVPELLAAGHVVVGLARSSESATALASVGAQVVEASLSDLDAVRVAARAADGVIHLAFRHTDPYDQALESDRQLIQTVGDALTGTHRPFVVTSGTLVLPPGRLAVETDPPGGASPAAARAASERLALSYVDRGVRVVVARLAPSVHDRAKSGFVGALVDLAVEAGFSGFVGDGSQRWPAVNRQDAARLFRLAIEGAPAGSILHGVGEQGVALRAVAAAIGAGLSVPVRSVPQTNAQAHFGWLAATVGVDAPASSEATRALLGWEPKHLGLLDDLEHGEFFTLSEGTDGP